MTKSSSDRKNNKEFSFTKEQEKELVEKVKKELLEENKKKILDNQGSVVGGASIYNKMEREKALRREDVDKNTLLNLSKKDKEKYLSNSLRGGRFSGSSSMSSARNRTDAKQNKESKSFEQKKQEIKKKAEDAKRLMKDSNFRKQRAENLRASLQKSIKSRITRKRNRSELNAMSTTIIISALAVSIFADIMDILLDLTAVGDFLAPITSALTGAVVGFLWWSIGSGDFGNKLKKNGKRCVWTCIIEAIPAINALPTFTIMSVLNLLDFLGFFDKKILKDVKKVIS